MSLGVTSKQKKDEIGASQTQRLQWGVGCPLGCVWWQRDGGAWSCGPYRLRTLCKGPRSAICQGHMFVALGPVWPMGSLLSEPTPSPSAVPPTPRLSIRHPHLQLHSGPAEMAGDCAGLSRPAWVTVSQLIPCPWHMDSEGYEPGQGHSARMTSQPRGFTCVPEQLAGNGS